MTVIMLLHRLLITLQLVGRRCARVRCWLLLIVCKPRCSNAVAFDGLTNTLSVLYNALSHLHSAHSHSFAL